MTFNQPVTIRDLAEKTRAVDDEKCKIRKERSDDGKGKSKYRVEAFKRADQLRDSFSAAGIARIIINEKKISGLPGEDRLARNIQAHFSENPRPKK